MKPTSSLNSDNTNDYRLVLRQNSILKAINNIHTLVSEIHDVEKLITKVCNIMYKSRGYNNIWIILFENNNNISNYAKAGNISNFTEFIRQIKNNKAPKTFSKVLKSDKLLITNNPIKKCSDCKLNESYHNLGSFSKSLYKNNKLIGIISASIPIEYTTNTAEHELFEEVSDIISKAIIRIYTAKEHKRTEQLLKISENQYQSIVESIFESLIIVNKEGILLFANEKAATLLIGNPSPSEVIGNLLTKYVKKKHINEFNAIIKHAFTTNKQIKKEMKIDTGIGYRWFSKIFKPITYSSSKEKAIMILSMDITEKKKWESELINSEEKFKFLSQATFEGIVIHNKGKIIDANTSFLKMTGYTLDEAIGKNLLNYIFKSSDKAKVLLNIVKKSAPPYTVTGKKKNGDEFIAELEGRDVVFNGKKVRIVALRNLSKKKLIQKNLEETQRKIETIFQNFPGLVYQCVLDKKWTMIFISDGCYELTGYTQEEIVNDHTISFSDIIHPDDSKMVWEIVNNNVNVFKPYEIEYRIITKNNEIKWVFEKGRYVFDNHNNQIIEGIISDITHLKAVEEQVRKNERKIQSIFSSAPIGIGLLENRILREVNDQLSTMTGYTRDELLNKNARVLYPSDKEYYQVGKVKYNLIEKHGTGTVETRWLTKDKKIIDILLSSTPLNSNDHSVGITFSALDITAIKNTERDLTFAKEKAEESDRLKSAFLANMSHEIRTPMNGILGFANLMKEPHLTKESKNHYIEIIQKSGHRMLNTINDLIDISKIESKQMEVIIREININKIIGELVLFFTEEVNNKGITLNFTPTLENGKDIILTDIDKFTSIITNLIKNAIKFTKKGGIKIEYSINDMVIYFNVSDTGIGIYPSRQKAIFDRFIQADIEDRNAVQGSGLGLSISKSYVEMLGGKIWLKSIPNKGSSFHFTLPYNTPK